MSKRELIDRIRLLNPTAPSCFLAKFGETDLSQYLENLQEAAPALRLAMYGSSRRLEYETREPRSMALAG